MRSRSLSVAKLVPVCLLVLAPYIGRGQQQTPEVPQVTVTSHVGAVGVMQVMPATGQYVSNIDKYYVGYQRSLEELEERKILKGRVGSGG